MIRGIPPFLLLRRKDWRRVSLLGMVHFLHNGVCGRGGLRGEFCAGCMILGGLRPLEMVNDWYKDFGLFKEERNVNCLLRGSRRAETLGFRSRRAGGAKLQLAAGVWKRHALFRILALLEVGFGVSVELSEWGRCWWGEEL